MGDRYILTVKCKCGFEDEEAYYAPTCGFVDWRCPKCDNIINLEEYSGISAESCSNLSTIKEICESFKKE